MKLKNFTLAKPVGRKERVHKGRKGKGKIEGERKKRGKQERSINVGGKNCEKKLQQMMVKRI